MTGQRPRAPQEANVILPGLGARQRVAHAERTPALLVLGLYLAATLIPALAAVARGASATVAVVHCGALLVVGWFARAERERELSQPARVCRDWLPLIAVPFLYAELPYLIAGTGASFRDAAVQGWESRLFGTSPAQTLAGAFPSRLVSEVLHAGYLSYYFIIYAPPLLLYLRGRRSDFARTTATLLTVFAVCFVIFAVFPVAGPRYEWPPPAGVPDGPARGLVLALLDAGSSRGTAFPSSHVAVAVAQTMLALAMQRRVGVVVGVCTTLLAIGAVYGGFHYAVDVLAGAVIGAIIAGIALRRPVEVHS